MTWKIHKSLETNLISFFPFYVSFCIRRYNLNVDTEQFILNSLNALSADRKLSWLVYEQVCYSHCASSDFTICVCMCLCILLFLLFLRFSNRTYCRCSARAAGPSVMQTQREYHSTAQHSTITRYSMCMCCCCVFCIIYFDSVFISMCVCKCVFTFTFETIVVFQLTTLYLLRFLYLYYLFGTKKMQYDYFKYINWKNKNSDFFEHLNFFYHYLKVNPMREV